MSFNPHFDLQGKHATLSASQYHWINYDEEKMDLRITTQLAAAKGTELHEFAAQCIRLKQKLVGSKKTLNMYVNDCIGFGMTPEQVLVGTANAFGTADAIRFNEKKMQLWVFDLKTGVTPASMHQLEVYCAYFCLEYNYKPHDLEMELRLYQNDEIELFVPDPEQVLHIMDKVLVFDKIINRRKMEAFA
jgi:hypothetical protein